MFGIHGDDVRTLWGRESGGHTVLRQNGTLNDAIRENDESSLHAQWKRKLIGSDYYGMLAFDSITALKSLGYTTQTSSVEGLLPLLNDGCDLKTYVVGGRTYDDTMAAIYQIVSNSNPAFDFEEPASAPVVSARFDEDDQSTENGDGDVIGTETYRQALSRFSSLSDEARVVANQYGVVYEPAMPYITDLGKRLNTQCIFVPYLC
jgi:hypothetical protein